MSAVVYSLLFTHFIAQSRHLLSEKWRITDMTNGTFRIPEYGGGALWHFSSQMSGAFSSICLIIPYHLPNTHTTTHRVWMDFAIGPDPNRAAPCRPLPHGYANDNDPEDCTMCEGCNWPFWPNSTWSWIVNCCLVLISRLLSSFPFLRVFSILKPSVF